jgi:hypothetical protein
MSRLLQVDKPPAANGAGSVLHHLASYHGLLCWHGKAAKDTCRLSRRAVGYSPATSFMPKECGTASMQGRGVHCYSVSVAHFSCLHATTSCLLHTKEAQDVHMLWPAVLLPVDQLDTGLATRARVLS